MLNQKTIAWFSVVAGALIALSPLGIPAEAQVPGGGLNASFVTYCTCGPGYLTWVQGVPGTPSGLYYFGPETQYWVGSGIPPANYLSFYTPDGGNCVMWGGDDCWDWTTNLMNRYGGSQ